MKEGLQLCIDFGYNNFWLYHCKTNRKRKFGETYCGLTISFCGLLFTHWGLFNWGSQ